VWIPYASYQGQIDEIRAKNKPAPKPLMEGAGGVGFIGDEIHGASIDWATGKTYDSKSTRAKDYEEKGLRMYGADEMRRNHLPDFGGARTVRTNKGTKVL